MIIGHSLLYYVCIHVADMQMHMNHVYVTFQEGCQEGCFPLKVGLMFVLYASGMLCCRDLSLYDFRDATKQTLTKT